MQSLLCINDSDRFFGSSYFRNPEFANQHGVEPSIAVVDEFSDDELRSVEEEHGPESIDGVLFHRTKHIHAAINAGIYPDTPFILSAMVLQKHGNAMKLLREIAHSDHEVYVFAGATRTARAYNIPDADNYRIILAPIMGRSFDGPSSMPSELITDDIQYDMGFWSAFSPKKQPHTVLETANRVGEQLGREITVWIGGVGEDTAYRKLVRSVIADSHYEYVDAEYLGVIDPRDLGERIQQTRMIYLPLLKETETTCYAAWEAVAYDVPVVGTDWAGVGEAIRNSQQPLSKVIPVQYADSKEAVFPESVREAYPDMVDEVVDIGRFSRIMIDIDLASYAIAHALENYERSQRSIGYHDTVSATSTFNALYDVMKGVLTEMDSSGDRYRNPVFTHDGHTERHRTSDIRKTDRGYSVFYSGDETSTEMKTAFQTTFYDDRAYEDKDIFEILDR